ncbi:Nucleic acid-binding protein [Gossypium australe]|uniref:Nucleic acid-binding protein n=1 Tax=Gossypium australe TaxID=47621 RepID=A0A5B6WER1_9ROSI|nr:Nucleic acid-binding protein [Gossypium australe]
MCIWQETTCITVVTLAFYCIIERQRGTICQQISQATCHKGWNHDRFLVNSFDEEILHIIGSLISAHTGSIRWLDRHLEEDSEFDRSSMKSRDREWLGDKIVDEGAIPMS